MALKQYNAQVATTAQPEEMTPESQAPYEAGAGVVGSVKAAAEGKTKKLPKKIQKQFDGYKTVLSKLLHSKETRDGTTEMLSSGPPAISVPQAALAINKNAEQLMERKGIKLTNQVRMMGSIFLVSDLIEMGNVGGLFGNEEVDEEETKAIYQDTLQDYIEKGLADGSIDPVELQMDTEKLMTPEQKAMGDDFAQRGNVPLEPTANMTLGNQRSMLESRQAQKDQAAQRKQQQTQGGQG